MKPTICTTLLICVFAIIFNNDLASQNCNNTHVVTNSAFEEKVLIFEPSVNGGENVKVDLIESNPFNDLDYPVKYKDDVFQMNIYDVNWNDTPSVHKQLKTIFPTDNHNIIKSIIAINSQVDVLVTSHCEAIVIYGAYGFDKKDEIVAFSSVTKFYDSNGLLIGEVSGNRNGDINLAYSNDLKYMLSTSMKLNDKPTSLRLINVRSGAIEYELVGCIEDEFSICSKIGSSNLMGCSVYSTDESSVKTRTFYVLNPDRRQLYVKTFTNNELERPLKILADGILLREYQDLELKKYSYTDDFIKISF